jgi:hypothetical protein
MVKVLVAVTGLPKVTDSLLELAMGIRMEKGMAILTEW